MLARASGLVSITVAWTTQVPRANTAVSRLSGEPSEGREKAVDIDIDWIEKPAIGGLIGTGALTFAWEHVMQRIDTGDCPSGLS